MREVGVDLAAVALGGLGIGRAEKELHHGVDADRVEEGVPDSGQQDGFEEGGGLEGRPQALPGAEEGAVYSSFRAQLPISRGRTRSGRRARALADRTAERMPDDVGGREIERRQQPVDVGGHVARPVSTGHLGTLADVAVVDGDAAVALRERGDLRSPHGTVETRAAQEDEGLAVADLVVGELDRADLDPRHDAYSGSAVAAGAGSASGRARSVSATGGTALMIMSIRAAFWPIAPTNTFS